MFPVVWPVLYHWKWLLRDLWDSTHLVKITVALIGVKEKVFWSRENYFARKSG